ncbi:MAG: aromatic amino acid ammonia-lyase [Alphaproteobacteria bacterium]
MARPVRIDHRDDLTLDDIVRAARGAPVEVEPATLELLDHRRADVEAYIRETAEPAYGFNRGFGSNVRDRVAAEDLGPLQENLIRSHAAGVGPPAPIEVVRATMLLRAKSLAQGYSAVRSVLVSRLVDALNRGVTPLVPSLGSVSASGDLAPLSHVALGLMGEGEAFFGEPGATTPERLPAAEALARAGLEPLELEMKEGLALNNGVQYSTALAALATHGMYRLVETATVATALAAQVMLGADTPFRQDLHRLRQHKGSAEVARAVLRLMSGSRLREAHRPFDIDGEIQDPYDLRCAAQILGPCLELVWRSEQTIEIEAKSVTDNPVVLMATKDSHIARESDFFGKYVEVVSGGHFHGMPIAVDVYGLIQAAAIIARLSNTRAQRYVDADRNKGLGPQLKWPGRVPPEEISGIDAGARAEIERRQSLQSSMMLAEYTSAGLVNWLWGQAMPSHLFSLSTDSGQEDHVSMAANVALRAYEMLPRLAELLAVELAFAAQAAAIRKEMAAIPSRAPREGSGDAKAIKEWHPLSPEERRLSDVSEAVLEVVGRHFPVVEADRPLAPDLARLATAVLDGEIVAAVEATSDVFRDFRPA